MKSDEIEKLVRLLYKGSRRIEVQDKELFNEIQSTLESFEQFDKSEFAYLVKMDV